MLLVGSNKKESQAVLYKQKEGNMCQKKRSKGLSPIHFGALGALSECVDKGRGQFEGNKSLLI